MAEPVASAEVSPSAGRRWPYGLAFIVLLAVHGGLTLQLFGRSSPLHNLFSDDPVTSGRHALNLEQGARGMGATRAGAFDPSCYAGYPRTAVFDAESRPAEWFHRAARRRFAAQAYKIGLALTYWLAPAALWLAAGVVRMSRASAATAAALAVLVAWAPPAREFIENGDMCIPSIAVLAALGFALFGRWHEWPCALGWCGLFAVTAIGWAVQPAWWPGVLILGLGAWAVVARRHSWRWHLALGVAQAAAVAVSFPAWSDWLRDWWVRLPVRRPFPDISLSEAIAISLWLAILPVAGALTRAGQWLAARPYAGLLVGSVLFLVSAGLLVRRPPVWETVNWGPRPLALGFPAAAVGLEEAIRAAGSTDARVLWEDLPGRTDLGWTVLLPGRLGRPFVGGLDADGILEHATCALRGGNLAGRPLAAWSDAELDGYARRYNIGCVVCATALARDRFARWRAVDAVPLADSIADWRVFAVHRPHSYVLKGQARQFEADARHVTMCDVIPEDGEVVLSLHYQTGWQARPSWVRVERELDPYDPIPFVRLRMPGPVGRVTLTWDQ